MPSTFLFSLLISMINLTRFSSVNLGNCTNSVGVFATLSRILFKQNAAMGEFILRSILEL